MTTNAYVCPATTFKSPLKVGPFKSPGPLEFPDPPLAVEIPVGPDPKNSPYELQLTSGEVPFIIPAQPLSVMLNIPQS